MVSSTCRPGGFIHLSPVDPDWRLHVSAEIDMIRCPGCETNIGMVVFLTHKKEQAEAILDGEGKWRCPKLSVLDRVLNALHEPRRDAPGDLPFGHAELIRVAAWLKGEAWFHRSRPEDRGRYDGRGRGAGGDASRPAGQAR